MQKITLLRWLLVGRRDWNNFSIVGIVRLALLKNRFDGIVKHLERLLGEAYLGPLPWRDHAPATL